MTQIQERNMCLVERRNGRMTIGSLRGTPGFSNVPFAKRATFEVFVDANQYPLRDAKFTVKDRESGKTRAQVWLVRTAEIGVMKIVSKPGDQTPFSWEKFGDTNYVPTIFALALQRVGELVAEGQLAEVRVGPFETQGASSLSTLADSFSLNMMGHWMRPIDDTLSFAKEDLRFRHASPRRFEEYLPTSQGRRFVCLGSSVISTVLHVHRQKTQVARVLDLLRDGNVREALDLVRAEGLNYGPIPEFSGREDKKIERKALIFMSHPALLLEILRLGNREKYATQVWPIQELGSF